MTCEGYKTLQTTDMAWNQQIRKLKPFSCFLFMSEAVFQCCMGFLSVYPFWDCEELVCVRLLNTGWLVLIHGVVQLLACLLMCFRLTVQRQTYKYILASFALWSAWVMSLNIYEWLAIYDYTKAWSEVVIIFMCLMVTWVILVIVQCSIYVHIVFVLPRKKTFVNDRVLLATDAD